MLSYEQQSHLLGHVQAALRIAAPVLDAQLQRNPAVSRVFAKLQPGSTASPALDAFEEVPSANLLIGTSWHKQSSTLVIDGQNSTMQHADMFAPAPCMGTIERAALSILCAFRCDCSGMFATWLYGMTLEFIASGFHMQAAAAMDSVARNVLALLCEAWACVRMR